MKILKLLNNKSLSILLIIFIFNLDIKAEEKPIDIWSINQNQNEEIKSNSEQNNIIKETEEITQPSIYKMQSQKQIDTVQVDSSLDSQEIKIVGLYDPEDYNLKIDMWSNSDGDQLKYLFSNLKKLNLSNDASELMNIALLTNSYYPKKI